MMNVCESIKGALIDEQRKWLIRCSQKARESERSWALAFRDQSTLRTRVGI